MGHQTSNFMKIITSLIKYIKSKKILFKVLSSSFLSLPVSIIVSFITFRYIEPYYLGIWATITILETYTSFLRIGIINGMNRELPFALGQGKSEKAMEYAQTTLAYTYFTALVVIIVSPFVLFNIQLNQIYLFAIIVGIIQVILNQYVSYLGGTYRTSDNFNKFSNIQFVLLGSKVILIPLIYYFAFYGYLVNQLLLTLINTILLYRYRPFHLKAKFNKKIFIELIKIGFPVFVTSYAVGFIATFPKLFILKYGSTSLLGLYAPVIAIIAVFSNLPNALTTYYYPKLSYALGKNNNAWYMYKTILKIYGISILLIIPLIIIIYFALDYFAIFFPKYKESLPYLEISLIIAPFVIAKLGNMINTILKQVNFMAYYVLFYGLFQIFFLVILYLFYSKDVLFCAIWSQILTYGFMLITSVLMNYKAVRSYSKLHNE